jgi:hypothetical protein
MLTYTWKHFHRYFLMMFDCRSSSIVLLFCWLICKTLRWRFSHHIRLSNHFYRSSLLSIYAIKCLYHHLNITFVCLTTYIVLLFCFLHCKTLISLFSHHIWLLKLFYLSSLLFIYTVNTSPAIFSSYLIAEALLSFFYVVDLLCKHFSR